MAQIQRIINSSICSSNSKLWNVNYMASTVYLLNKKLYFFKLAPSLGANQVQYQCMIRPNVQPATKQWCYKKVMWICQGSIISPRQGYTSRQEAYAFFVAGYPHPQMHFPTSPRMPKVLFSKRQSFHDIIKGNTKSRGNVSSTTHIGGARD